MHLFATTTAEQFLEMGKGAAFADAGSGLDVKAGAPAPA
jgi:hypothetical protein